MLVLLSVVAASVPSTPGPFSARPSKRSVRRGGAVVYSTNTGLYGMLRDETFISDVDPGVRRSGGVLKMEILLNAGLPLPRHIIIVLKHRERWRGVFSFASCLLFGACGGQGGELLPAEHAHLSSSGHRSQLQVKRDLNPNQGPTPADQFHIKLFRYLIVTGTLLLIATASPCAVQADTRPTSYRKCKG